MSEKLDLCPFCGTDIKTLKPCPFCGSDDIHFLQNKNTIFCIDCGGSMVDMVGDGFKESNAVGKWNKRIDINGK